MILLWQGSKIILNFVKFVGELFKKTYHLPNAVVRNTLTSTKREEARSSILMDADVLVVTFMFAQ